MLLGEKEHADPDGDGADNDERSYNREGVVAVLMFIVQVCTDDARNHRAHRNLPLQMSPVSANRGRLG
jgi:hypothetical protein